MGASSNRLAKIIFISSCAFLALMAALYYGYSVGRAWTGPWMQILTLEQHINSLRSFDRWVPGGLYKRKPKKTPNIRYTVHDKEQYISGYRAIMGWDELLSQYVIWLFNSDGEQIHYWPIDYSTYDSQSKPLSLPINPHGMAILPDGSALINFGLGGKRLVKIDACGRAIWTKKGIYHHSIEVAETGTFWTLLARDNIDGTFQSLVELDVETGKVQRKIDLVDLIRKSDQSAAILGGVASDFMFPGQGGPRVGSRGNKDVFHPNDVEALPSELADNYPLFDAGDLLVSIRNRGLVVVLDANDASIKWWRHGPWDMQHDPDYGPDGRIYVYNNNPGRHRSSIMAIDPVTSDVEQIFANGHVRFYSNFQGKQQLLPNGMIQVTVPEEGRVIEASPDGSIAFEFINIVDDKTIARVLNSTWLPANFFQDIPSCQ